MTDNYKSQIQAALHYWQRETADFSQSKMTWLDDRYAILRQAVEEGVKDGELWEDTAVVITQVFPFIEWRGYWLAWIPILEKVVQREQEAEPGFFIKLNIQLAQFYRLNRRFTEAQQLCLFVLKQAEILQNDELIALVYRVISQNHLAQNQLAEAERFALLALTHSEQVPDHKQLKCFILQTLGAIKGEKGENEAALVYMEPAVAIRREFDEPIYLADILNDLARVYENLGAFEKAHQLIDEALAIINQTHHALMKFLFLMNKGVFYYRQNRLEKAGEIFAQIDFFALKRQGNMVQCGMAMQNLGNVLFDQGEILEAEPYIQEAAQIFRTLSDEIQLANSLGTLAQILSAQNKRGEATEHFKEALALLEKYPENAWAKKLTENFLKQQIAIEKAID